MLGNCGGELCTRHLCKGCYNQKRVEKNEPITHQIQWRRVVCQKRSRGKLAVGLGFLGLERKIMEIYVGKRMYTKNLLEHAAAALCATGGRRRRHTKKSVICCESKNLHLPGKRWCGSRSMRQCKWQGSLCPTCAFIASHSKIPSGGYSGRCGSQRGEGVSGSRSAAGCLREPHVCCTLVETTWSTRSSRACRSRTVSKSRMIQRRFIEVAIWRGTRKSSRWSGPVQ